MDRYVTAAFAHRPEATDANLVAGDGDLAINGFEPEGIGNTSASGIFANVIVPIFDGKMKNSPNQDAADRLGVARLGVSISKAAATCSSGDSRDDLRRNYRAG